MEEARGTNNNGVEEGLLHKEKHFTAGEVVRDVIIGMSDGLTVPFALAAGLSAATASSSIIVTAGLAEVAAGAISMGLGGYLAAKSEADHYERERNREQEEIVSVPDTEAAEVADILEKYGLQPNEYWPVVNALRKRPDAWLDFMMRKHSQDRLYRSILTLLKVEQCINSFSRLSLGSSQIGFELGLEKPDPMRGLQSAFTIAISYVIGGLVPLIPYMFIPIAKNALMVSVIVTLIALLFFGYAKGYYTGSKPIRSAIQTAVIGAFASAAAFGIARVIRP